MGLYEASLTICIIDSYFFSTVIMTVGTSLILLQMNQLSTNLTEFIQAKTKFPLVEKINSLTWRETDI